MEVIIDGIRYVPQTQAQNASSDSAPQAGGYRWSERSRERLKGVHPDLVRVLDLAITRSPIDMTVLEGLRTLERQNELLRKGATTTLNSRHLTGHAVDIAPLDDDGKVSWAWPLYYRIAPVIKNAAAELNIPIEWGGDWESFKDGSHWQLPHVASNASFSNPWLGGLLGGAAGAML